MPTKSITIRIEEDLLKYLTERAEQEHRTLSNMIISILMTEKERDETGKLIDADVLLDKIHEQMAQRIKWSMDSKDELSVKEICKAIDNTPAWK